MPDEITTGSAPTHQNLSGEAPKDSQSTTTASPPPAYAPPPAMQGLHCLTQFGLSRGQLSPSASHTRNSSISPCQTSINRPLNTTILAGHADEADLETDEELLASCCDDDTVPRSAISLRINTSVNVTKANNIVCIGDAAPVDHANAIAKAVVKAIDEHSSGHCGIPMIDEDGRPRPLKIEIDASMLVEGSGNIVGNSAAVLEILRQQQQQQQRGTRRKGLFGHCDDGDDGEAGEAALPVKRRRCSK